MKYNWQHPEWPNFQYKTAGIQDLFLKFIEKTGRVDGLLSTLPESDRKEAVVDLMVSEAVKSAEIEGEMLSRPDVMSSIKKNLGFSTDKKKAGDRRAQGMADLMLCVRNGFEKPLGKQMLFDWHAMLMKGSARVQSGAWRIHNEPMRVVSGNVGDEIVHYEAPPSTAVPAEMKRFIQWFNQTAPGAVDEIENVAVRAAIAHLYFESIHPFEDGNGRIGRALSEKALSQGIGRPVLLSLSQAIEADRAGYYAALKKAQRSLNITDWLAWFSRTLLCAQQMAETRIAFTIEKTRFFDRVREMNLNDRQLKVLRRMLEVSPDGFQGGMSTKKYMAITKTSKPSATRDLQVLVAKKIFIPSGGGRSTRYRIEFQPE